MQLNAKTNNFETPQLDMVASVFDGIGGNLSTAAPLHAAFGYMRRCCVLADHYGSAFTAFAGFGWCGADMCCRANCGSMEVGCAGCLIWWEYQSPLPLCIAIARRHAPRPHRAIVIQTTIQDLHAHLGSIRAGPCDASVHFTNPSEPHLNPI